jgi:hypothetical protein
VNGSSWQELITLAEAIEQVLMRCEENFYPENNPLGN